VRVHAQCPFCFRSSCKNMRQRMTNFGSGATAVVSALVEVDNLVKHFRGCGARCSPADHEREGGRRRELSVAAGETLALVGESGCGKSTVSRLVLRLIEPTSGSVRFEGQDVFALNGNALRAFRRKAQLVFQGPLWLAQPAHDGEARSWPSRSRCIPRCLPRAAPRASPSCSTWWACRRRRRAATRTSSPAASRQRVAIARALAVEPKLVICDEPVSALDVSIRSQILNLLRDLQRRLGLAYIFISHDLAVVKPHRRPGRGDDLGLIVETAPADVLFAAPRHPYSHALLSAIPTPRPKRRRDRMIVQGDMPSALHPPLRLPVPHPLPPCGRALPRRGPGADRRWRPCDRLPSLAGAARARPGDGHRGGPHRLRWNVSWRLFPACGTLSRTAG